MADVCNLCFKFPQQKYKIPIVHLVVFFQNVTYNTRACKQTVLGVIWNQYQSRVCVKVFYFMTLGFYTLSIQKGIHHHGIKEMKLYL